MTHISPTPHNTTANGSRARRRATSPARQARIRLISEGVLASYIHDISVRTPLGAQERSSSPTGGDYAPVAQEVAA
jgi:hypothetical protein